MLWETTWGMSQNYITRRHGGRSLHPPYLYIPHLWRVVPEGINLCTAKRAPIIPEKAWEEWPNALVGRSLCAGNCLPQLQRYGTEDQQCLLQVVRQACEAQDLVQAPPQPRGKTGNIPELLWALISWALWFCGYSVYIFCINFKRSV